LRLNVPERQHLPGVQKSGEAPATRLVVDGIESAEVLSGDWLWIEQRILSGEVSDHNSGTVVGAGAREHDGQTAESDRQQGCQPEQRLSLPLKQDLQTEHGTPFW